MKKFYFKFYKFTPELNLSKGNYSKYKPDNKDKLDINIALEDVKKTNSYSHIQGVVSRNKRFASRKKRWN